ncbi:von willebrand factor type A domain protein, putative (macronuclear) [Tetrahymena thermophila SB210]|uniref:von willebrand factor type A domain protein, putative n=1 Tax=Tetrahymena thermophila (strain SB210) TaxID=312017 RepID=W7X6V1_TETTS|nr:von willebrand factor type A domain protein, putative [Tetrahymena thermophila SB210]EWS75105.1 von willebrand factor type A domain protein, putative [Tetrahymena thermophila SB210]|eukprot:XP_012652343.1 von willebrand factor type A domain protein, putative [Tetrahymena thermophila SB210]
MKIVKLFSIVILCISAVFTQSSNELQKIIQYGQNCHYSCNSCIGNKFYECTSCQNLTGNYNNTIINPKYYIDGVSYLSQQNLSVLYGECTCSPNKDQYSFQIGQGCAKDQSLERYLDLALKALIYSNLGMSGVYFLTSLKIFYLVDLIETLQYFGNFAMINHKNIGKSNDQISTYLNFNPTFLLNHDNSSFIQFFQDTINNNIKPQSIKIISQIPTQNQLEQQANSSTIDQTPLLVQQYSFQMLNQLQNSQFKLSQALDGLGSDFSYFQLGINFQMVLLCSYIILALFLLSHFLVFEKKYLPQSKVFSTSSDEKKRENKQIDNSNYLQKYQYENSKYYQIYQYVINLSLTFYYLCLNEQLIYLQISFYLGQKDKKDIIAICIFFFISAVNLVQLIYFSRRSSMPTTNQKTVIFDHIKFINKGKQRYVTIVKLIFKVSETIIFYQLYSNTTLQIIILLSLAFLQFLFSIYIKAFVFTQYNALYTIQQAIKIILLVLHLVIQLVEQSSDQSSLDKLNLCLTALQFCYTFAVLFYNLVMYLQDLCFYCFNKGDQKLNFSSVSPLSNQSFANNSNYGKENQKLINLQKSENIISLNQSQLQESVIEQIPSFREIDQKQQHNQQLPQKLQPQNRQQYKNSEYFNLGFQRKVGHQTELIINPINKNPDFEDVLQKESNFNKKNTNQQKNIQIYEEDNNKKVLKSQIYSYYNEEQQNNLKQTPIQMIQNIRQKQEKQQEQQLKPFQQPPNNNQNIYEMFNAVKENVNYNNTNKAHMTTYRK